jgi:hypothetical protein
MGQKTKKIKNSSPSAFVGTRGRGSFPECRHVALGEEVTFPECKSMALGEDFFQFFGKRLRPMLLSNANFLLRVPLVGYQGEYPR